MCSGSIPNGRGMHRIKYGPETAHKFYKRNDSRVKIDNLKAFVTDSDKFPISIKKNTK